MLRFGFAALTVYASLACADPFAGADPGKGKALVEKSCGTCHSALSQGDPNRIFTRPDRKVKNARQLLGQVHTFSTNTGAGWSADDETNAAAYLNQAFYKFQ